MLEQIQQHKLMSAYLEHEPWLLIMFVSGVQEAAAVVMAFNVSMGQWAG